PGGPPLCPPSPSPLRRIRSPVSTPGGIFTASVLRRSTRPLPPQDRHGSLITEPAPRQRGHVCCSEKNPCDTRIWPAPPQSAHFVGCVPLRAPLPSHSSHAASTGTRISTVSPRTAFSSSSSS